MKILLSPLDWGLGHATRLIPIIKHCIDRDHDVHVAASGLGLELLKKNFKDCKIVFHNLSDLNISYSRQKSLFIAKLGSQFPDLLRKKKADQKTVLELHNIHKYQLVISDNRYGIHIPKAYNIFITHQVQILTGKGKLMDNLMLKLHRKLYKNYQELWVMDHEDRSLALVPGLSHPNQATHPHTTYIGHLSQFNHQVTASEKTSKKILLLLSGPEPARSILLSKLIAQAIELPDYQFTIVSGSDKNTIDIPNYDHITIMGIATAHDIDHLMKNTTYVVCRSGYSTVMDLLAYNVKALMIPTPGQSEQEYLAQYLSEKKMCVAVTQDTINLNVDIEKLNNISGFPQNIKACLNLGFQQALNNVLNKNL